MSRKYADKKEFKVLSYTVKPEAYLSLVAVEDVLFHFGQNAEDAILLRLLNGKTNGFYVDVGAFHPRKYSNTFLLYQFYGWSGINIDASKTAIEKFNQERPQDINLHIGISKEIKLKDYYVFEHSARNTFSKQNLNRQIEKGDTKILGQEKVQTMPLGDILDKHLPKNKKIDVMNIDIEGYEIEALESNNWEKYQPKIILIEDYTFSGNVSINENKINSFLIKKGYKLFSHTYDTSIYVHKRFKQCTHEKMSTEVINKKLLTLLKNTQIKERHDVLARGNALGAKINDAISSSQNKYEYEKNELKKKLQEQKRIIGDIYNSNSWKITKPLRKVCVIAKKLTLKKTQKSYDDPLSTICNAKTKKEFYLKTKYKLGLLSTMLDTFVLYRIIGNDLYPRHKKGQSLQNLKFILENEPELEDCEKRFVINRIFDDKEEKEIISLLERHKKKYLRIPFEEEEYKKVGLDTDCLPTHDYLQTEEFNDLDKINQNSIITAIYRLKNNYVMNNNGARNAALREGKSRAKWILPWDGNCFISKNAWEEIKNSVKRQPHLKYFVVPMSRVLDNKGFLKGQNLQPPVEEPQLIFRKDSKEEFNEDYCYGRRPKVEMFWRLGIPGKWDKFQIKKWDQLPKKLSREAHQFGIAGWVARLFSGKTNLELNTEKSFIQRGSARNEAIVYTLRNIDKKIFGKDNCNLFHFDLKKLCHEVEQYNSRKNNSSLKKIVISLLKNAGNAIDRGLQSVVNKTTLPPSGNRHDYWHPAPYWWPNSYTKNGLPYVRIDGKRVTGTNLFEEKSEQFDRTRLQYLFDDTVALTLAWKFTKEKKYADHADKMLKNFFVNAETRMNPHLKYSQVIMGHNNNIGPGSGIIEMKDLYYYLDAICILRNDGIFEEETIAKFNEWLEQYLEWLQISDQGKNESMAKNNHGTYYDLQIAAIANFLGDEQLLFDTMLSAQCRIADQFKENGSQPNELERKTTLHYCTFNLQGWLNLGRYSTKTGNNLWNYESKSGASIRKGLDWLIKNAEKQWNYEQIDEFDYDRLIALAFSAPKYVDAGETIQRFSENIYKLKPKFFPHDGIRPYWNLGLDRNWAY